LTVEQARAKLARGLPLLEGEAIAFDLPSLHRFAMRLCDWASEQALLAADAAAIQHALATGTLNVEELLGAAASGEHEAVLALATRLTLAPALLRTLAELSLSAGLMDLAQQLMPLVREAAAPWDRPICPICGGDPLLAELQGSGGERMLRCATCGGGWRALISQCAHCGTSDSTMLHYLATEGEEGKYRIDLCDRCRGAMKGVTTFTATPPELLLIEDTALLHLLHDAQARGYTTHPAIDDDRTSDGSSFTPRPEG
jgi:FdhE protein